MTIKPESNPVLKENLKCVCGQLGFCIIKQEVFCKECYERKKRIESEIRFEERYLKRRLNNEK